MLNTAFEPWPSFTLAEADAVSKVLLSNKKRCWGNTGKSDKIVSAAPIPITAPEAPAPTLGNNARLASPMRSSS